MFTNFCVTTEVCCVNKDDKQAYVSHMETMKCWFAKMSLCASELGKRAKLTAAALSLSLFSIFQSAFGYFIQLIVNTEHDSQTVMLLM